MRTQEAAGPPRSDVVAVIPAFRCEGSIGQVVTGVLRHTARVVVVDDGSEDETSNVASRAGAEVERFERNQGKGAALRRGIDIALEGDPEAVLLLDADGQHAPEDIPALLAAWDRGDGQLVVGTRLADRAAIPGPRYWTNVIGSRILSLVTGYRLEDSQSGYRLLDASLLRALDLRSRGYAVESEMLIKAAKQKASLAQVRVRTIYEEGGTSHFRPFLDTWRIFASSVYFKLFA